MAERFPPMLYAGPGLRTETPTIHELHANLYFEWHQFNQPPEIVRAGLDKAAAADVQVLMALDRLSIGGFAVSARDFVRHGVHQVTSRTAMHFLRNQLLGWPM